MLDREHTALVIVDVQGKLARIMHDKENLFKNIRILIQGVKLMGLPIIWMEQVPEKLGPTIPEISELLTDMKPIAKSAFSCARSKEFNRRLEELHIHQILLAGIETHVCVYQTAIDLLEKGYNIEVVADAVSSRTDFNKQIGLDRILLAGGTLTSVEMALFELQQNAEGDRFKQLIQLVK